ncbi:AAA family ATPase [Halalkalibaculum sp. DA384]|uniref:AAA family ATPase n=1 Tax=Halalkalibaculum sp. DA384 TaxID=3373606 RepID=UPI003754928D
MESSKPLSSASLEMHLFGRFEVIIDGQALNETEIKGRKARTLLRLIAHQRNFQMAREHATDLLWPDLDQNAANAQLYKAIHHIRKAFTKHNDDADDWINITDDFIKIDPPGGVVTDGRLFEQAARTGIKERDLSELEHAASIYSGEFLPMDRYAEWASLPREHYRQLYLDVLTALAGQYEKRGELSEAAEMLRLALEKEPTLETAHRGLMRVFAKKGQETRAFHQYEVCRERLGNELGMDPSKETIELLDNIREGQLKVEKKQRARLTSFPESIPPIIGRVEECNTIEQLLDDLSSGRGSGLIISGEAGIGKTRLVRELILRARRRDIPFFLGRSGEASGNVAYGPFIELFDDILYRHPELEEELPVEIGRLVPTFAGEGIPAPHADKLAAKGHLFARVQRLFAILAQEEYCAVILEDLHAADQGSRELFSYLIRHLERLPVLIVATLRKGEGEPEPEFIRDMEEPLVEKIELAPLTYEEHIGLLQQYAEHDIIGADTARQIYQLAEGNPFYALELLRHYREKGDTDHPRENEHSEKMPESPVSKNIPSSLHQLVDQKLEKLSPPAHHLLYIAAVIGRQVPYELLAYVWSGDHQGANQELFTALEEVVRERLLEEKGLDYSFRHALVQETIYSSISQARRKTLHRQVADRLLELSTDAKEPPVEQIAWHYLGAGDMFKGAQFLIQSAERAESAYAHEDALQRYREACEVLDNLETEKATRLKREMLERIGDVYRACGKLEMSYEAYEEAISIAEKIAPDNTDLVELYRKMAVVAIFRTEIDRSATYLEKAFDLVEDDDRAKARVLITKALHLWHLNRLKEAYDIAKQALQKAEKAEAKVEASQAREILAMTCLPLGRWEEGLQYEMDRQYHGWSPEIVVATDAHLCLWEYHISGDQPLQRARSFLEQIAEQASEMGDFRCVAVCHYALGTMHLWRGQRHQAVEELAASLELHEQVGSPAGMAYSLARKSVLHTLTGASELGWQAIQDGLAYANQAAVRDHCLQRLYGVGIWNRIESDDIKRAQQMVEKSEALLDETGACGACALELYPWMAYFYLHTGQLDRARECGDAVSQLAEKTDNPIGKAVATIIESSLCITQEDRDRAEECREKSYQILQEAVPETTHSPVAHYLECMVDQQDKLGMN